MSFKELAKFTLLVGVALVSVLYILNRDYVDSLLNIYLDQPTNIVVTDITPRSFTVTWLSLAPDYGAVLMSDDSEITEYRYNDNSYDLFLDSREISTKGIFDTEIRYTHTVTIDNLIPGEDYYFAITNGKKVWGNEYLSMSLDNIYIASESLYVRLPTEIDFVEKPKPLVGSVISDSESSPINNVEETVVLLHGRNSGYKYSTLVDSRGYWIADISMYDENDILDIYYYLPDGEYLYSKVQIDNLSHNNSGYYEIEQSVSAKNLNYLSEVAAQENIGYCCAYLVEGQTEFFGSYGNSICDEGSYQLKSINNERLCNNTFDGVCCNTQDDVREWKPKISCASENRQEEYTSPDTCNYEPLQEYSIQISITDGLNVLDTHEYLPIGRSRNIMDAASFLNIGGSEYVTYIAQFENYQWNILLKLQEDQIVGENFGLDEYQGYLFYSTNSADYKISAYLRDQVMNEHLFEISHWDGKLSPDTYETADIYYIDSNSIANEITDLVESDIKGVLLIK